MSQESPSSNKIKLIVICKYKLGLESFIHHRFGHGETISILIRDKVKDALCYSRS